MSEKKSPFLPPYSEQSSSTSSPSNTEFQPEMTLFPITSHFVTSTTTSPATLQPPLVPGSTSRSKSGSAASGGGDGQPSFKCEHCGRGFLFKNNLKAHLRTHTRDRKYTCAICQKSFIYKESLKNHMLLHSNELPYHCDICGKKFRDRSNRRKHVKNVHKYLLNSSGAANVPLGSASGEVSSGPSPSTPEVPRQRRKRTPRTEASTSTSSSRRGSTTATITEDPQSQVPSTLELYEQIEGSTSELNLNPSSSVSSSHYFSHHGRDEYRTQLQSHPHSSSASTSTLGQSKHDAGMIWPPIQTTSSTKKNSEVVWPPISIYPTHHQYTSNPYPGTEGHVKGHLTSDSQDQQYSSQYMLDQYHHLYSQQQQSAHYWNTAQPPESSEQHVSIDYSSGPPPPPPPAYHLLEQPSSSSLEGYSASSHQHMGQQTQTQTAQSGRSIPMSIDNQNTPTSTNTNGSGGSGSNPVLLYKDLSQFDFSYL